MEVPDTPGLANLCVCSREKLAGESVDRAPQARTARPHAVTSVREVLTRHGVSEDRHARSRCLGDGLRLGRGLGNCGCTTEHHGLLDAVEAVVDGIEHVVVPNMPWSLGTRAG